ncbi:uncharacterized protein LOC107782084 [Nicotiana tabacum]|uniref:Uncharacterized protein LOC107782084 n=1 Tax=Nicotiana tabacum TaxID=4097 RepID=A0A1S3Z1Q9_TOBAC
MYKNDARPNAKFIMWLQLQDKLLTTDRLAKWGITVDLECVMCHTQPENRNHSCMDCDFAITMWNMTLIWLQKQAGPTTRWNQHVAWIIQNAKGRTQQAHIFRSVYTEFVYAIWMERNQKIFEKKSRDWESIDREIAYLSNIASCVKLAMLVVVIANSGIGECRLETVCGGGFG